MNIEIKNLKKKFDNNFILKDININIEKNKSTIILGKSGCGKSVLIKIIYKLLRYQEGDILYNGKRNVDIDKFSMLFQYGALFDSLTVSENIAFTDLMENKLNYSKKVKSLMKDVGLDSSNFHKYPSEISGGMKKRTALARALYKNPKVIFLDEPTTGLDPINSDLINDLIVKVIKKRKITAVTITHDIKSAIKTGDNFFFIENGITEEKGRCDQILSTKNKIFKSFITGARY
tara:strand:+ start:13366 stop:14064 length:699 start_codon:yes stop_codon:yes gene_type:complete